MYLSYSAVPIKWGFVRPRDVYGKSDVEKALSGSMSCFSQKDSQAEGRARESEWMNANPARMIELNRMRDAGKKYDFEYDMRSMGISKTLYSSVSETMIGFKGLFCTS